MSSEDARKIVQNGLDQLKIERKEREAALDAQEQQLRRTINVNHTARTMTAAQHQAAAEEAARKRSQERAMERREEAIRTMKADRAVRLYGLACLVILLLARFLEANPAATLEQILAMTDDFAGEQRAFDLVHVLREGAPSYAAFTAFVRDSGDFLVGQAHDLVKHRPPFVEKQAEGAEFVVVGCDRALDGHDVAGSSDAVHL